MSDLSRSPCFIETCYGPGIVNRFHGSSVIAKECCNEVVKSEAQVVTSDLGIHSFTRALQKRGQRSSVNRHTRLRVLGSSGLRTTKGSKTNVTKKSIQKSSELNQTSNTTKCLRDRLIRSPLALALCTVVSTLLLLLSHALSPRYSTCLDFAD